jgi:hypothetical protein
MLCRIALTHPSLSIKLALSKNKERGDHGNDNDPGMQVH